jgi:hypothetical protein
MGIFVDSMDTILEAHRLVALLIADNTEFAYAIPLLRALLHIAIDGQCGNMTLWDEKFRAIFDSYLARLKIPNVSNRTPIKKPRVCQRLSQMHCRQHYKITHKSCKERRSHLREIKLYQH